jgi:hypothetical protein
MKKPNQVLRVLVVLMVPVAAVRVCHGVLTPTPTCSGKRMKKMKL